MKPVLFLYPPFEGRFFLKSRLPFPMGPLYIASYMESKGVKAVVKDFSYPANKISVKRPEGVETKGAYYRYGMTDEEMIEWLTANLSKYHSVIGISSLMSTCYHSAYHLADLVKQVNPKVEIVLGGPHVCTCPEHIAEYGKSIDKICLGEGELPFLRYIAKGRSRYIIEPASYDRKKHPLYFLEDMDILPPMKRKLLLDDRQVDYLMATFSRGCPMHCEFCTSYVVQGRDWRHMTANNAVLHLMALQKEWNVTQFEIEDDNLCPGSKGKKWIKEFCETVEQMKSIGTLDAKTRFHVPHGLPVHTIADEEVVETLWSAGFRNMVFPVESTNPSVLKDMKKAGTPEHWKKANTLWSKHEKHIPVEIIIGYPFIQTIETMLETFMDVAEEKGIIWASHFRLNRGTLLFSRCVDAGYAPKDYNPLAMNGFSIGTERFSLKDLQQLMQVSRAINYGTVSGFNCFTDNPDKMVKGQLTFAFPKVLRQGGAVADGSFGFVKGQAMLASVVATRMTGDDRMLQMRVSEDKAHLVFNQAKESRVFRSLLSVLKSRGYIKRTKSTLDSGLKRFL